MTESVVMDIKEAAVYLATTVGHIRALVYRRQIPYKKAGKYLRFVPAELDAWLDATTQD